MNYDVKLISIKERIKIIFIILIIILLATSCKSVERPNTEKIQENIDVQKEFIVEKKPLSPKEKLNLFFEGPVKKSNEPVSDEYFNDVVFIGDSVTAGIQLYKACKNALVISQTGLTIETIVNNKVKINDKESSLIEVIKESNRKKIYIMIGSNGIGWLDFDYMIKLYGEWLSLLRSEVPECIIYVQSVIPITEQRSKVESKSKVGVTNEKIDSYNAKVFEMCKNKYFHYLDVSEVLKNEQGVLSEEASPVDGMHIGIKYYNIWIDYIKTHIINDEDNKSIRDLIFSL